MRKHAFAYGRRSPDKSACGGVAMGLIKDKENGNIAILTDIQASKLLRDMDFKVAGTKTA